MVNNTTTDSPAFNSRISFLPLIRTWKDIIQNGREGSRQLYKSLLSEIPPELLQPIEDEELLKKHSSLIDRMMATIFPVTFSDKDELFAVLQPFNSRVLYASTLFNQMYNDSKNEFAVIPDKGIEKKMDEEKLVGAYQLIMSRLYKMKIEGRVTTVHQYKCPKSGLDKYMELEMDSRFIDVRAEGKLPHLPPDYAQSCSSVDDILKTPGIQKKFPISNFWFEGLLILRMTEVTDREIINKIKNSLLNIHSFSDEKIFGELDYQMQNLAGVHKLHTAIKPFFMVNNHLVLSEIITTNTTAKKFPLSKEKQYELYKNISSVFKDSKHTLLISDINQETIAQYPFLYMLYDHNFKSVIVAPLFKEMNELLGILIIAHRTETLGKEHLARIKPAIPLFAIALEKSQEHLDHQVDKIIKDQFTAVQDAVEWRFTKAALNYLTKKDKREQNKMEPIVFENVFPLYGAIDIRNSSIERNNAIQQDLLEQLQQARNIIIKAEQLSNFPLLKELQFRIEKYSDSVSRILFAEQESAIHDFLTVELVSVINNLSLIIPSLEKEIKDYLQLVDSPVKMLYNHRRNYEESITRINSELAGLIDAEQQAAQAMYPHYFERFVTDGLDYNVYVGQSISPRIPFNEFYLKNLKIWQLSTLVKAARLTHELEKQLPLPLQTTQLILAHSTPISISFRAAERKFDVDGAYNMRYEIIKKRIDKVRLQDSNERLTQPGTIAIVYSQSKEALEYEGYLEFLQSQGLLKPGIEKYDLEELQGISGLKGLRVSINFEEEKEKVAASEESVRNTELVLDHQ